MSITKDFEKKMLRQPPFYIDRDVDLLLAHTRALEEMLKNHQWGNMEIEVCLECGKDSLHGHSKKCKLAKLLDGVDD